MTKLSYVVGNKSFTSAQYKEAKQEAKRQGTLITPVYTPIDTIPRANPARIAKLAEARQKRIIESILQAMEEAQYENRD